MKCPHCKKDIDVLGFVRSDERGRGMSLKHIANFAIWFRNHHKEEYEKYHEEFEKHIECFEKTLKC